MFNLESNNPAAPICRECGVKTFLTNFRIRKSKSKKYHRKRDRLIYMCPICKRYVNTHPNTNKPLGFPGDKELRLWREFTHYIFDQLWDSAGNRKKAYAWLSRILNLSTDKCHIGMFDSDQCKKTIEACIKEMSVRSD